MVQGLTHHGGERDDLTASNANQLDFNFGFLFGVVITYYFLGYIFIGDVFFLRGQFWVTKKR